MQFDCYRPMGCQRREGEDIEWITQAEVQNALKKFHFAKASADVVHAEVLKPLREEMSQELTQMFNHILQTAQVPACWRGAEVRAVPKPKDRGAYRPISLLAISQRVFTRVLLGRLRQVLSIDPSQMALSRMGGCEQAHAIVSAVDLWAKREKLAMAHLHIDLRAAFDSILRQVLVGVHDDTDQTDDEGNTDDLTFAQLQNLALFFEVHCVPLLQHRGAPAYLLDVLRNMQGGLWAQIPDLPGYSGQSFVSIAAGVRQGCSLSPWLFSLYVGVIMSDLDDMFKERGLDFVIPVHSSFPGMQVERERTLNAILFADDITFLRADEDGLQLLRMCRQVMQMCKATFKRYCLQVNQGPGKTELCIHFPRQASALKAGLAQCTGAGDGKKAAIDLEDGSSLIVSASYLFLGRWSNPSGSQCKEVKVRRGAGLTAVKEMGHLLRSVAVPVALKVNECSSVAVSRLSYCLGVCDLYTARDIRVLSRGYYLILQAAIRSTLPKGQMNVPYVQLVRKTGLPTFETLRYSRILSFYGRLAVSHCELTYSALGLSWGQVGSWSGCLVKALTWLQSKCDTFRNVSVPAIKSMQEWTAVVRLLGVEEFKGLVKKAVRASTPSAEGLSGEEVEAQFTEAVQPDKTDLIDSGDEDNGATTCSECGKICASRAGLVNHLRTIHGISASIADRVSGHECRQCGGSYGSRTALIAHLRLQISPVCRAYYQALPPATQVVPDVQPTFRTKFTRRGRKRREGGLPKSDMVTPIVISLEQGRASGTTGAQGP
eukprot:6483030-Amphidinium_carterae.1